MGHYSELYDQENEGTYKEKKKEVKMITVVVPEGSTIIPPGEEFKWANKIVQDLYDQVLLKRDEIININKNKKK